MKDFLMTWLQKQLATRKKQNVEAVQHGEEMLACRLEGEISMIEETMKILNTFKS